MNIIFGKDVAEELSSKHTLLELDTITIKSSAPITVYCVIEHIPLDELPKTEALKEMHSALMENYRKRNWQFCEEDGACEIVDDAEEEVDDDDINH